jgi:hypothetical protein
MSLDTLIMFAGAGVLVLPFLGFTIAMQQWMLFALGIIILGLGIAVRRRGMRPIEPSMRTGEFVESVPTSNPSE